MKSEIFLFMNNRMKFGGLYMIDFGVVMTAMVTPFNEEKKLDLAKTEQLVNHLIAHGTDTIIVAGTTGEGPTLTKDEKMTLFSFVSKIANKRVKVIANAGTNNTQESVDFVKVISKYTEVDGIMLVNPYYNKPSQEGLYQHFKTIAENTQLPIMLYNIPGRTSVNLTAKTTIRLSEIQNIVAIKESSGDLSQMARIIGGTKDSFALYSGDDNLTLPIVSIGGKGVVSVASHIFGNEIKRMIVNKDASLHRKLLPFFEGIFFTTNPVPIKNALNILGVNVGSVRLPLVDTNDSEKDDVKSLLVDTKISLS